MESKFNVRLAVSAAATLAFLGCCVFVTINTDLTVLGGAETIMESASAPKLPPALKAAAEAIGRQAEPPKVVPNKEIDTTVKSTPPLTPLKTLPNGKKFPKELTVQKKNCMHLKAWSCAVSDEAYDKSERNLGFVKGLIEAMCPGKMTSDNVTPDACLAQLDTFYAKVKAEQDELISQAQLAQFAAAMKKPKGVLTINKYKQVKPSGLGYEEKERVLLDTKEMGLTDQVNFGLSASMADVHDVTKDFVHVFMKAGLDLAHAERQVGLSHEEMDEYEHWGGQ